MFFHKSKGYVRMSVTEIITDTIVLVTICFYFFSTKIEKIIVESLNKIRIDFQKYICYFQTFYIKPINF